jgi:hypothetical protein
LAQQIIANPPVIKSEMVKVFFFCGGRGGTTAEAGKGRKVRTAASPELLDNNIMLSTAVFQNPDSAFT